MLSTGEVREEAELYALRLIEQGRAEAAGAGEPESAGKTEDGETGDGLPRRFAPRNDEGEPGDGEPENAGKKPGRKKGSK